MNEREEKKDNQPQANAYNALSLIKNATIFSAILWFICMYICMWFTDCPAVAKSGLIKRKYCWYHIQMYVHKYMYVRTIYAYIFTFEAYLS